MGVFEERRYRLLGMGAAIGQLVRTRKYGRSTVAQEGSSTSGKTITHGEGSRMLVEN